MVFAMILCGRKGNSSAHLPSCFQISTKELRVLLQALTPQACGHSGPQETRSQESVPASSILFSPNVSPFHSSAGKWL